MSHLSAGRRWHLSGRCEDPSFSTGKESGKSHAPAGGQTPRAGAGGRIVREGARDTGGWWGLGD